MSHLSPPFFFLDFRCPSSISNTAYLACSLTNIYSNATIKENGPSDVYASGSTAYCNTAGGSSPFLYCTVACTQYYNQTAPYLACYYTPRYPACDVDTLYASNFTSSTVIQIQTSAQLNAELLKCNTNSSTKSLSLQPGSYTLTATYTPVNNLCIVVSTIVNPSGLLIS